jgi:quercetin dioxygenase-like cupin family protein
MIDLKSLDLVEAWSASDPRQRVRFAWAISGETGSDGTSVAYVELPVGGAIPSHFDSANEIDYVLEGMVEWEFDGKHDAYSAGTLIEIPAGRKHCAERQNGNGAAAHLPRPRQGRRHLRRAADADRDEGRRELTSLSPTVVGS